MRADVLPLHDDRSHDVAGLEAKVTLDSLPVPDRKAV